MKQRNWLIAFMILVSLGLAAVASLTWYVDPYLHYHKPHTDRFYYTLNLEQSQNDGIIRNFEYDTLFTGTSMTENAPTSQIEELFGGKCIKLPSSGAGFAEIDRYVRSAAKRNPDLKTVFRCLDEDFLIPTDEAMFYSVGDYPEYLYNDNPFDDVNYLLNRDVFLPRVIQPILGSLKNHTVGITDFDEYGRWEYEGMPTMAQTLDPATRFTAPSVQISLTEEEKSRVFQNITENALNTAIENPQITFYYYLPPYSAIWWALRWEQGKLERQAEAERLVIETLLQADNIRLFSFHTVTDITGNLENYRDSAHYLTNVNRAIAQYMADGVYQLTKDNYETYLSELLAVYSAYDYNAYFLNP